MKRIPLAKPYLPKEVVKETLIKIEKVLNSGHLTQGSIVEEFEDCAKEYIGCKYAIAVSNCTVGMEIVLKVFGIGLGDSVIVPAYTHPATHQVIRTVLAYPRIVDVVKDTALLDFTKARQALLSDVRAIMPVSLFGNPLERSLIPKEFGGSVYVIEDAACGLGSSYSRTMTGNFPDVSVFSFHPRKVITTGEGGLVTTNDEGLAEDIRDYLNFGGYKKLKGTNGKMSDINAAIGVIQFKHLDFILEERRELAEHYKQGFQNTIVSPLKTTHHGRHSYQSFVVLVSDASKVMKYMESCNIESQIGTKVIGNFDNYPTAAYLNKHTLTLPMYCGMSKEEQDFVIDKLLRVEHHDN